MNRVTQMLKALVISALLAGGVGAAELAGNPPFAGSSFGQQSDASGPAYAQGFTAPNNGVLEAIRWWGFHGANSMGATFDNFVVMLDGVVQTGALSVVHTSQFFDEYTLDIADAALTATTLSVVNDSLDVEWFWQSAPAVGNPTSPSDSAVAFSLIGHADSHGVPEPSTSAITLLALIALAGALATRRTGARPGKAGAASTVGQHVSTGRGG